MAGLTINLLHLGTFRSLGSFPCHVIVRFMHRSSFVMTLPTSCTQGWSLWHCDKYISCGLVDDEEYVPIKTIQMDHTVAIVLTVIAWVVDSSSKRQR